MSTEQATELTAPAAEQPSKLAGGCVLAVGAALASGVVYAVPEVGYTIAGALAAAGVRRARTWATGRRERPADELEAEDFVDIVAALHELSAGGEHVRLTQLQELTGLPDTKTIRALLDEAGIAVRRGVRTAGGNGPGVHADDIPPLEPVHEPGCWCRSGTNTNANNADGEGPGEGFRVEAIGAAGTVVRDPAETRRRYAKTPARSA